MQRWAYFAMGAMSGLIAVLSFMLLAQHQDSRAYAARAAADDSTTNSGVSIIQGGTQQQIDDMVWVLYRRPGAKQAGDGGSGAKVTGDSRLTLACYKILQGGRGKMQLVSIRDITYDVEVVEWPAQSPTVREIKKELEKQSREKDQ